MWCFKNANFSAFNEIHSLFLDDFSESKLLKKEFFSLKKNKSYTNPRAAHSFTSTFITEFSSRKQ